MDGDVVCERPKILQFKEFHAKCRALISGDDWIVADGLNESEAAFGSVAAERNVQPSY